MGIHEVLTDPQSPWQNSYVERLIGSIRRECLDHVIVLSEAGLRRVRKTYFDYYDRSRTDLALGKDAPAHRVIQPPALGQVIEISQVGGLHHRYSSRRSGFARKCRRQPFHCCSHPSYLLILQAANKSEATNPQA